MPVSAARAEPARSLAPLLTRFLVAATAVALVAGLIGLGAWLFAPGTPPAPARAPFGAAREAAPSGAGATLLAIQAVYYRQLQAAVTALRESGAVLPLVLIGFAYGAFHAAGPGHGKAVIGAYLVASDRALRKAVTLSFAAALVQALVAISLVGVLALLLGRSIAGSSVPRLVEAAGLLGLAVIGALITWRKAGVFLGVMALAGDPRAASPDAACDHHHLPPPDTLERRRTWRETLGLVLAAGSRPCTGAVVILVFALAQGFFLAGVAATLAMALGTALTTSAIATLAVFAKALALRLAGGRGAGGALTIAGLELLAAAAVLALGLVLLLGLFAGGAPS